VLPQVIDEIVNCRDTIAQEYLMEVIIQVFPDEFHLRTLDIFLGGCAKLQTSVDVKQLVIGLIERFSQYAERTREETRLNRPEGEPEDDTETGIPKDIDLFQIFWAQIVDLVRVNELRYVDKVESS
jgi:vacuolar protein sorting-associated protein 35